MQWPVIFRRKTMKRNVKLISLLLALVMVIGLAACGKAKDTDPANAAYVTLTVEAQPAQAKDNSYIAAKAVEIPAEGSTVGDVIKAVHKNLFKDGEAGFATAQTQYGESITKMWGIENGGSYGYYVNGAMAMGLTDPVKPGDRVDLLVYKDAAGFSDAFMYMEATATGTKVDVTVKAMSFDANWNPVMKELAGAKIYTIGKDGKLEATGAATNEKGVASLELKAGIYRLVAINTDGLYTVSAQKVVITK